jgi:hypothetical protein
LVGGKGGAEHRRCRGRVRGGNYKKFIKYDVDILKDDFMDEGGN